MIEPFVFTDPQLAAGAYGLICCAVVVESCFLFFFLRRTLSPLFFFNTRLFVVCVSPLLGAPRDRRAVSACGGADAGLQRHRPALLHAFARPAGPLLSDTRRFDQPGQHRVHEREELLRGPDGDLCFQV